METEGVTAEVRAAGGAVLFAGAAVLRLRPHPRTGAPHLHLGVPDDALGFRPAPGQRYELHIERPDGSHERYVSNGAWLERVQSSWWFVLDGVS